MKALNELLKQEPVFLNDWAESKKIGVISDFEDVNITNVNILFASYGYANYAGDAWVLFEEDGKLYEVNGAHCSCRGLEGQWKKEPVVLEQLKNRLENGTFGTDSSYGNEFATELKSFLGL